MTFPTQTLRSLSRCRRRRVRQRSGSLMLEAVVAIVIAVAILLGVAQWLALVAQQRRDLQQHNAAAHEAGNLMEEFASLPWGELTAEKLGAAELSPDCRQCLPDAKLHVEVTAEDDTSKRVRVAIDWPTGHGPCVEAVRLSAWRYPAEEARP